MERLTSDIIFDSENRSQDLVRKSVRGGITTMTAQGIQFILRLGGIMILARLLTPTDYGLIGMVMVIVNFAAMFKDAGLSMATVQREEISHQQISTLFWLNFLISVFLGLCVLAGSSLVAWFYNRSELTAVTAALSVSFLITGLTIQHQALLRRHMRFGSLAFVQIVSYIANLFVMILAALLGWRYWALVAGTIAMALSTMLLTFYVCPWIPGRLKRGTGVRDMFVFGGHLTGFNFVNYFARNADNVLIGRYIGADALGLYARAYQLLILPITQIRAPLVQVAMPVLSALKDQPDRYIRYYQCIVDVLASLAIPLTLYCALEAEFLIQLLLGPRWLGAVPVFRILAVAGLIQAVAGTRGLVLLSLGSSKRYLYWGLCNAILCGASFVAGLPFGIEGVAAAYAIVNYAILIPSLFYCFHATPVTVSLFLRTLVGPLVSGLLAAVGVVFVKHVWASESIAAHCVSAVIFTVVYVGLSLCRRPIRETTGLILKGLSIVPRTKLRTA